VSAGARPWRRLAWVAAGVACAAYAVLSHRAASTPNPGLFEAMVFIVPLMAGAGLLAWRSAHRAGWLALWLLAAGALFLAREHLGEGTAWVLLLQHVGINLLLMGIFARTLAPGQRPLLTRLAHMVHGDAITPRVAAYTRGATWAWVGYFGLMALVSLALFVAAPLAVWSGFVNLLSLPLLGLMFAGEFALRVLMIPRAERSGFVESVQAYRRFSGARTPRPE
jgi:uncharacterized membrane protein